MSKPSYKREFGILFLIVATELIGFGLIIPILPQIAIQFKTNGLLLGILLGTYSFAQFFASPILGSLSDKYGRKPILILSKCGTVISYIILAFSFTYPLFVLARFLDGFTGGNISVARAYIADITKPEDRAKGMAIIGIAFGTGFILGPALGAILFGMFDTHTIPALVAGSLSLLAAIFTIFFLKEPTKHQDVEKESLIKKGALLKDKNILIICLVQFLFMLTFAGFETSFSVFTNQFFQFTEQDNSLTFFYIGILALVIQGVIVRRPFKNTSLAVLLGLIICGGTFILLSQNTQVIGLLITLAIFSLGIGLLHSHLPALLTHVSHQHQSGKVMGIYEAIGSLSRIWGPLIVYTGFYKMLRIGYLSYGILLTLTALFFWLKFKQFK